MTLILESNLSVTHTYIPICLMLVTKQWMYHFYIYRLFHTDAFREEEDDDVIEEEEEEEGKGGGRSINTQ